MRLVILFIIENIVCFGCRLRTINLWYSVTNPLTVWIISAVTITPRTCMITTFYKIDIFLPTNWIIIVIYNQLTLSGCAAPCDLVIHHNWIHNSPGHLIFRSSSPIVNHKRMTSHLLLSWNYRSRTWRLQVLNAIRFGYLTILRYLFFRVWNGRCVFFW